MVCVHRHSRDLYSVYVCDAEGIRHRGGLSVFEDTKVGARKAAEVLAEERGGIPIVYR